MKVLEIATGVHCPADMVDVNKILLFSVEGTPMSVNHAYGQKGNRRFMYKEGRAFQERVKLLALSAMNRKNMEIFTGPLWVHITYCFADWRVRDVTNYEKALIDSLSGTVFKDDSQIFQCCFEKRTNQKEAKTIVIIQPLYSHVDREEIEEYYNAKSNKN